MITRATSLQKHLVELDQVFLLHGEDQFVHLFRGRFGNLYEGFSRDALHHDMELGRYYSQNGQSNDKNDELGHYTGDNSLSTTRNTKSH
jgi:hypothetical protein